MLPKVWDYVTYPLTRTLKISHLNNTNTSTTTNKEVWCRHAVVDRRRSQTNFGAVPRD